MKAVILAGGYGKRLRPLTDEKPKPMIEVLNIPIIEWQVKWLSKCGIKEFVVCVGYMKEQIIDHIGSGSRLGVKVGYAVEEEPLGTGGALSNAASLLAGQDSFFMLNGDVLTEQATAHQRQQLAFAGACSAQEPIWHCRGGQEFQGAWLCGKAKNS
jgi:NDP-sugar pyrophosphorylase family protein